jgi:hypothetical protein
LIQRVGEGLDEAGWHAEMVMYEGWRVLNQRWQWKGRRVGREGVRGVRWRSGFVRDEVDGRRACVRGTWGGHVG